jgi:DNA-binding MarR family transcriptional regulator
VDAPKWLDHREHVAWRNFQLMQAQLSAVLGRELTNDAGLSFQDYSVLVVLTDHTEGHMRQFELGHLLGWEKSRLSHHITRMIRRGLVRRQSCPTDQRGTFIAVTDHGRGTIESAAPAHVTAVRRYFIDVLTTEELDNMSAIGAKVLKTLGDAGQCEVSPLLTPSET